jgi:hypothetical protein
MRNDYMVANLIVDHQPYGLEHVLGIMTAWLVTVLRAVEPSTADHFLRHLRLMNS